MAQFVYGYYRYERILPVRQPCPRDITLYLPASNFTGAGALTGWCNSIPTFANNADVNDNGINNTHPKVNGITSDMITLALDTAPTAPNEPNSAGKPTPWAHQGRFQPHQLGRSHPTPRTLERKRRQQQPTVDFGFIPPLSLGNRVWIDDGSTAHQPRPQPVQRQDHERHGSRDAPTLRSTCTSTPTTMAIISILWTAFQKPPPTVPTSPTQTASTSSTACRRKILRASGTLQLSRGQPHWRAIAAARHGR